MAVRFVASSSTLENFRTTFNSLGTDVGDLSSLTTSNTSSLVAAINEAAGGANNWIIRDESSTTQTISGGDTLNIVGSGGISAVVSATDTLTISLDSSITGLSDLTATNLNGTTITGTTFTDGTATLSSGSLTGLTSLNSSAISINNIDVATKPFAVSQAIALG